MLTISVQDDNLCFKDITKDNLKQVLDLYNQNKMNMYATGIDGTITIEDINERYLEVLVNSHEFFVGIIYDNKMIGVIKGRIDYESSEEAWISSIIIDNMYQKRGLGRKSISKIINILNRTYDVKRFYIGLISGNKIGMRFWKSLGFSYLRTINGYIKLNNKTEDFIIMRKKLVEK